MVHFTPQTVLLSPQPLGFPEETDPVSSKSLEPSRERRFGGVYNTPSSSSLVTPSETFTQGQRQLLERVQGR